MASAGLTTVADAAPRESDVKAGEHLDTAELSRRLSVSLDIVRGFRTGYELPESTPPSTAEPASSTEPQEASAWSAIAALRWPLGERWTIGARAPLTIATFQFSEREERRVTALGNLEIGGALRLPLGPLETEIELGVALPTATGDEYAEGTNKQNRAYANLAAQRFRGYLDNALFSTHRFGIVPAWKVEFESDRVKLSGFTKLEILANAGATQPPPELGTLSDAATELVTGARIRVQPFETPILRLSVRSWVAWTLIGEVKQPDQANGENASRVQFTVEPELSVSAGRLHSRFGMIIPIGGDLGSNGYLGFHWVMGVEF
jgi:hypothetical protein